MKDNYLNLKKTYIKLGLKKSQCLYITTDFRKLVGKNLSLKTLETHFNVIKDIIGKNGTIVVPTATLNLCNTNKIFDPKNTPSYLMGSFSEFVRKKALSKRSFHALWSVSAYGKLSDYLTNNISPHAFGYGSVWTRLIKKNAMSLHIGVHPRQSISIVHYTELMAGVPYRFTKEFNQFVKKNKKIIKQKFYHFCLKKNKKIVRDKNKKIYKNFTKKFRLRHLIYKKGKIYLFPLKKFVEINVEYLAKNPYAWTKR